ncbi:MAG: hypothetical protein IJ087_09700, partial [Eggerthellaceae bacterium]|nr:hypothetical protein [Eggerthellaceae bacterium]
MTSSFEFAYETGCRYFPMTDGKGRLVAWLAAWADEHHIQYYAPNCKISSIEKAITWFSKSLGDDSPLYAYA